MAVGPVRAGDVGLELPLRLVRHRPRAVLAHPLRAGEEHRAELGAERVGDRQVGGAVVQVRLPLGGDRLDHVRQVEIDPREHGLRLAGELLLGEVQSRASRRRA
jgi:hypothetical protein